MSSSILKIGFAGTPDIAKIVLESLVNKNSHNITRVFTQPDRPAGRGQKINKSQVKQYAIENDMPVLQPRTNKDFVLEDLEQCDLLLVIAYGMILPAVLINKPKYGCINIHTSLLPRWRGAAPIQRAIQAGDKETGITFMQMDKGMDTGAILAQNTCPIYERDTSKTLHDRLAMLAANNIHKLLDDVANELIKPLAQDNNKASYAKKITKQEALLDWNLPAINLDREIRAFNPFPIAFCELNDIKIRIWEAKVKPYSGELKPGSILKTNEYIDVVTKKDILSISKIQLPGKKVVSVKSFLNGKPNFFN